MMRSIPQRRRVSMERMTIDIPPTSMNPFGIVSVIFPKRLPKPAAMITAVEVPSNLPLEGEAFELLFSIIVCNLDVIRLQRFFQDDEEIFNVVGIDST